MEIIIYIAIAITGVVFGSFFTLAVYRIPRKENIVYVRSHCTTCGHKLNFWDLIPVFSYIFLGGKCRYCGEKIRIRYLLLEVFSGIVFLTLALTTGLENIVDLIFTYLFMAGMFIIAGIDKENYKIPNGVIIYEFCIAIAYFIFNLATYITTIAQEMSFNLMVCNPINYMSDKIIGAFVIPIILLVINKLVEILLKDKEKSPIGYGDIKYLSVIGLMFGFPVQILGIALSSIIGFIGFLIHKYKEIPWGYYLSIATIIVLIISPYIQDLLELIKVWG